MMNRHARAAAIREQLQRAQAAGQEPHNCPECAESALYVALVTRIETHGANAELVDAVTLLERPAAPGIH